MQDFAKLYPESSLLTDVGPNLPHSPTAEGRMRTVKQSLPRNRCSAMRQARSPACPIPPQRLRELTDIQVGYDSFRHQACGGDPPCHPLDGTVAEGSVGFFY